MDLRRGTFETIDWDLEAQRVTRAFDLNSGFVFIEVPYKGQLFRILSRSTRVAGEDMKVIYQPEYRSYSIVHLKLAEPEEDDTRATGYFPLSGRFKNDSNYFRIQARQERKLNSLLTEKSWLHIDWNGRMRTHNVDEKYTLTFARALVLLDLLTPEIEAALGVTVSAHQKAEWILECGNRYGF